MFLPNFTRCLITLAGMIAGAGISIVLVNRFLSQSGFQKIKRYIPPAFLLVTLSMGSIGYFIQTPLYILIVVILLVGLTFIVIQNIFFWGIYSGSPPIERNGVKKSLFRPITTTDLSVLRYEIQIPTWTGKKLRATHISDLHVTDQLPIDYYHWVVEMTNRTNPDIIVYSGDFLTEIKYANLLDNILNGFEARYGIYAIFGNHDFWTKPKRLDHIVQSTDIQLIHNQWKRIGFDEESKIIVQGCEEPWSKTRWTAPTVIDGELNIVLSHTADNIYRLSQSGAHIVFSGHYHAGQFQIPGIGPIIIPSRYGHRFYQGHFIVQGSHLFVSAGVGAAKPPLRIYCQPDIQVVDIYGK